MKGPANNRAGRCEAQADGHLAFIPGPIPRVIDMGSKVLSSLCEAERALGCVSGVLGAVGEPEIFARLALYKEAVLSAQMEGGSVSVSDVLWYALDGDLAEGLDSSPGQARAAINYAETVEQLLPVVASSGMSTVVLRQAHKSLHAGLRSRDNVPGAFRSSDIWIGPSGSTAHDAQFVPPPHGSVPHQMNELNSFLHEHKALPTMLVASLVYYHLETVYPFVDANGRVARILTQLMIGKESTVWPQFVSLASVFGRDAVAHFNQLQRVRLSGDWNGWLVYFLQAVRDAAEEGVVMLNSIMHLRQMHRQQVQEEFGGTAGPGLALLDSLCAHPLISVPSAVAVIGRTFANTNNLITRLQTMELLVEITGRRRRRRFCYAPYARLFDAMP